MKRKEYTQPQFGYIEHKRVVLAISTQACYDEKDGTDLVTPGQEWWL